MRAQDSWCFFFLSSNKSWLNELKRSWTRIDRCIYLCLSLSQSLCLLYWECVCECVFLLLCCWLYFSCALFHNILSSCRHFRIMCDFAYRYYCYFVVNSNFISLRQSVGEFIWANMCVCLLRSFVIKYTIGISCPLHWMPLKNIHFNIKRRNIWRQQKQQFHINIYILWLWLWKSVCRMGHWQSFKTFFKSEM